MQRSITERSAKSPSRSRQIVVNTLSQWAVTLVGTAGGLILVPFLIRRLGAATFGLVGVAATLASLCLLADVGISGALGRHLTEALAKNDKKEYETLLSTAAIINFMTGTICAAVVFIAAPHIVQLLAIPRDLFDTAVFLVKVYGASHVLFMFIMPSARAVLSSHNRFDLSNQVDGLRRLIESIGLLLVVGYSSSIVGWVVVCLAGDLFSTFLLWLQAVRLHGPLGVTLANFRKQRVKELLRLGNDLALLQIGGQLSVTVNPFLLTRALGPVSVSVYRPATQAVAALAGLVGAMAGQLYPLATAAYVNGQGDDLKLILIRGTKYTMLMGALSCAVIIPLAHPLFSFWLRSSLGAQCEVSAAALIILLLTSLFDFAGGSQWSILLASKCTRLTAYGRLALSFINLGLSWYFVRYTSLGVIGVLVPTLMIEMFWRPIMLWYTCKIIGLPVREYLRKAYLGPLMASVVVMTFVVSLRLVVGCETLGGLLAVIILAGLAVPIIAWTIGLDRSERAAFRKLA